MFCGAISEPLFCSGESVRFGYALVEHSTAAAAIQILQPVAPQAVFFEGHQRLAVLSDQPQLPQ